MPDLHRIGIVGAGRAGLALALASMRAGWPVRAVSSRDAGRRAALAHRLPGAAVVATPDEVAALSDVVMLAVPDDAIRDVATSLHARPGSVVAHLSGAHPAGVLRDALAPGVWVGAFHPLVAFADVERAASALDGASVVIDGDPAATAVLVALAGALGARPVTLAPSVDPVVAKAAHHAAAVLAAGGFVALLDVIAELGRVAGLTRRRRSPSMARSCDRGLPTRRCWASPARHRSGRAGRCGTLAAHLEAIGAVAPDARDLHPALRAGSWPSPGSAACWMPRAPRTSSACWVPRAPRTSSACWVPRAPRTSSACWVCSMPRVPTSLRPAGPG
ncbi:MAG: NAD(P)-binding domain-containing protein [Chloroflexota bacterium]